ncbi:MAG: hypothetical protein WKF88_00010 [Ferruginibacter sp.]
MKKFHVVAVLLFLLLSCKKESISTVPEVITDPAPVPVIPFTKYTIGAGQQFSAGNAFLQTSYSELKFMVKFDNSAVYTTTDPANQYDINKLYGFADNNAHHQQFSARFGWRWSDQKLRLFAYVYNNGVRDSRELGIINIGEEINCKIKITPTAYIFSMNAITESLPRTATTAKAEGYRLYPYFGGNESAPHEINIWIKEL